MRRLCYILFAWLQLVLLTQCQLPPRRDAATPDGKETGIPDSAARSGEYIMISAAVNLPLYVNHEQTAFRRQGKKLGVHTEILGNDEWDVQKIVEIIEQVITQRPAGLLINGTDPGLSAAINKAVAAGIPVIVYDSEIPGSHPNSFIGSDWYQMGYLQGLRVAARIGGKGKIACIGILGLKNQEDGFRGLQDAIKQYPGISFVGKYNDAANIENAATVTGNLIAAVPDIAAICGFTSATGPGIALAVREGGKAGKIIVTCVDFETEHLRLIRDGLIQYTVGQKRELFGMYGLQFLYDLNQRAQSFSVNDRLAGVNPLPVRINTGLIEIDSSNVRYFLH